MDVEFIFLMVAAFSAVWGLERIHKVLKDIRSILRGRIQ